MDAEISLLKPGSANDDVGAKIVAVATRILRFDSDLTETFLGELKQALPDAEQEGKLNVYRNTTVEELDTLHAADRFLVECLKIYRLRPRVDGMLFRARFEENIVMLEGVRPPPLANSTDALPLRTHARSSTALCPSSPHPTSGNCSRCVVASPAIQLTRCSSSSSLETS